MEHTVHMCANTTLMNFLSLSPQSHMSLGEDTTALRGTEQLLDVPALIAYG